MRLFDVYFQESAFKKASVHFLESSAAGLEALGFLVGSVYSFNGRKYVMVEDYLTSDNDATAVSVRFSQAAFSKLSRKLKRSDGSLIVGWAHSHPSYGCFLSRTDVRTQGVFFPEDFHFAFVCDPVRGECKAFKLIDASSGTKGAGYKEVSFAIVRKKTR